jgi:hypothetical protein
MVFSSDINHLTIGATVALQGRRRRNLKNEEVNIGGNNGVGSHCNVGYGAGRATLAG